MCKYNDSCNEEVCSRNCPYYNGATDAELGRGPVVLMLSQRENILYSNKEYLEEVI